MDVRRVTQDEHYARAADEFGPALGRLARAYEHDPDRQRDLLQDIHFALWRSFESYQGLSSLRTWVYRVAHNTAATHVLKAKRSRTAHWVDLAPIIIGAVGVIFVIVVLWVTTVQFLGAARLQRMIEDLDRYREK